MSIVVKGGFGQNPAMATKHSSNADLGVEVSAGVSLRMPKPLKSVIEKAAYASRRSLNAQIIYLLQIGLAKEEKHPKRQDEKTPIWKMDNLEDVVLLLFRELTPDKQLALIQLLRKD